MIDMAENEHVNKVELSDGNTLIDLTGDTVAPADLRSGATAHDASGAQITGVGLPLFSTDSMTGYDPPVTPCMVLDTSDWSIWACVPD